MNAKQTLLSGASNKFPSAFNVTEQCRELLANQTREFLEGGTDKEVK